MRWTLQSMGWLAVVWLAAGCGGGGGGGGGGGSSSGPALPHTSGNTFAAAAGPGDAQAYLPLVPGNSWNIDVTLPPADVVAGAPTAGFGQVVAAGAGTLLGVPAVAVTETDTVGTTLTSVSYHNLRAGGVTYLGNSDSTDTVTPSLVPFVELAFPVTVGTVSHVTVTGADFGRDLNGSGHDATIDVDQTVSVVGFDTQYVPAGNLATAHVLTSISGTIHPWGSTISLPYSGSADQWLAPGVGPVRTGGTVYVNGVEGTLSATATRGYTVNGVTHGFAPNARLLPTVNQWVTAGSGNSALVAGYCTVCSSGATWGAIVLDSQGRFLGNGLAPGAAGPGPAYAAIGMASGAFVMATQSSLGGIGLSRVDITNGAPGPATSYYASAVTVGSQVGLATDGQNVLVLNDVGGSLTQAWLVGPTGTATSQVILQGGLAAAVFDGSHYVVAVVPGGAGTGVTLYRIDTQGNLLDPSGIPVASTGTSPALATDGSNSFLVWCSGSPGTTTSVLATRVMPSGALLDTTGTAAGGLVLELATDGVPRTSPVVAWANGEYLAEWVVGGPASPTDTRGEIHVARISASGSVVGSSGATSFALTHARSGNASTSPASDGGPRLVVTSDGHVLSLWSHAPSTNIGGPNFQAADIDISVLSGFGS